MTTTDVEPLRPETAAFRAAITLGLYTFDHLGDCLCVTPVPRLLHSHRGVRVYVPDVPNSRAVFTNNPYVRGFAGGGIPVFAQARGNGRWIQPIQQGSSRGGAKAQRRTQDHADRTSCVTHRPARLKSARISVVPPAVLGVSASLRETFSSVLPKRRR